MRKEIERTYNEVNTMIEDAYIKIHGREKWESLEEEEKKDVVRGAVKVAFAELIEKGEV